MESEITTAETGLELPLAEPHFEDEATLLSARPVVPLAEVESYEVQTPWRFARGWLFAATVIGAMVLGVVAGVAYFSYASRQPSRPLAVDQGIVGGVDGMAIEPVGNSSAVATGPEVQQHAGAENQVAVAPAPAGPPVVSANENRKPVARRVDVLTWPSNHQERKAARRLANQQKSNLERESRDRNLTRIREIFEGPQRP